METSLNEGDYEGFTQSQADVTAEARSAVFWCNVETQWKNEQ